jgi:ABC-type uncharacterized transport system ATPase subunit
VYEGEISALKRSAGASYTVQTTDDDRAVQICRAQRGIADVRREDGRIWFSAEEEQAVATLSQALVEGGALIRSLQPQTARLEDLFFSLTEASGRDEQPVAEPTLGAAR